MSSLLLAALVMGLMGSLHCAAMCGGIAAAAVVAPRRVRLPQVPRHRGLGVLRLNAGRVFGYALAGAVAGGFGHIVSRSFAERGRLGLQVLSAALLLWMGVSLLGVLPSKFTLERWLGGPFRLAAPLRARLLPAEGGLRDLAFGLLWGLLPCGLVYGALALSMASGTPLRGALVMLTFGLGTVPALTLVSLLAQKLGRWAAHPQARLAVGLVMLTMGLVQLHRVTFAAPPECCTTDTASAGLALSRSSSSHGSLPAVLPLTPP